MANMDKSNSSLTHCFRPILTGRRKRIMRAVQRRDPLMRLRGSFFFFFVVFIVFFQAGVFVGRKHRPPPSDALEWPHQPSVVLEHPIPRLMEEAEMKYRQKLIGQSKTLKQAVNEYKRRYKRHPPKGFDAWWKFAKRYNVKMVDEYDGMIEDLAPFWGLSGLELRRRVAQVGGLPSIDVVRVRNGTSSTIRGDPGFQDSEGGARARGFRDMLTKFEHRLPDMDFPVNTKAEGRVLLPWEYRAYPNMTLLHPSADIEAMLNGTFRADWGNTGNVWDAWRRTCSPPSPARRLLFSMRNSSSIQIPNYFSIPYHDPSSDFSFIPRTSAAGLNFCSEPHEHYMQGLFFSDWRTIPALYPVFSPAKAKGFLDIKIPSHYYYGNSPRYTYGWDAINIELKELDRMEKPWEKKVDKVFWRGATTGGGNHPSGFSAMYQRHRFIRMASENSSWSTNRTITFAYPSSESYVAASVPVARLNEEIMDVAFVKAVSPGTYPGGLEALKRTHRFGDAVPLGEHWSYKYLVDLDGMGYSGRFMAFLASDSVPVKATVYEEYFRDWIQPWVHFIPLSSTYREIYNIHAYFSGPTRSVLEVVNSTLIEPQHQHRRKHLEGDRRLRRIARAGKQWKKTIGRKIDMEVYVYRLSLEWARLWADDRDSMGFIP